jgi:predicted GNAT family N-acyltransferase
VIRIKSITTSDKLYAQEIALREQVLLKSVGLTMEGYNEMFPGREESCEHFVAVFDHPRGERVIGTATMLPPTSDEPFAKVNQVCVNKQRQGEGIGTKLMIAIEARAFGELSITGLYCHAQLVAMPFYENLGWAIGSDTFIEAGIEHKRMQISAPMPAEATKLQ